jgi:hypothetical protein
MSETTRVNAWLAELAAKAGIDGLALDDQGCAALRYSTDLDVMIELPEQSPVLQIYAPMLPLSVGGPSAESTYRQLLAANLFALETRGASFALDEANERVLLQYQVVIDATDAAGFERILGNFLDAAAMWKSRLGSAPDQEPAAQMPDWQQAITAFSLRA